MKRIMTMALLALFLSGCHFYSNDYRNDVLEYAMITDSDDLSKLDEYPNLEYVDLRGSTCYDAILAYAAQHPDVTVRYNVGFGEKRFDATETDIVLNGYETDYESLLQNLKYLPDLKTLHLNQAEFTGAQMEELISAYPGIDITYSVELCGRKYENSVEELDLSHLTSDDVDDAIRTISMLPQLRLVNLTGYGTDGRLSLEHVAQLTEGCPGVDFNYEFTLFGQRVSTLDETLAFDSVQIGNEGVDQIRSALAVMTKCHSVRLDSCGIDNEVMAQLRAEYPDKNISWRVFAGRFSMMTDEEMIRMNHSLRDEQASVLKYCTKVKYMDLTSSKITNIDFANHMPDLECVVLTLTKVEDLSPLANCANLTWLEISSCSRIKDLSALSGLRNLKYLNISNTSIKDVTSLEQLPLERFNCVRSGVKNQILEEFVSKHPDCLTTAKGYALEYGWRYNDKQLKEPFSYYAHMQEVFRYNDKTFKGNTK